MFAERHKCNKKVKVSAHGAINICHGLHVPELQVYTRTVQTVSEQQKQLLTEIL